MPCIKSSNAYELKALTQMKIKVPLRIQAFFESVSVRIVCIPKGKQVNCRHVRGFHSKETRAWMDADAEKSEDAGLESEDELDKLDGRAMLEALHRSVRVCVFPPTDCTHFTMLSRNQSSPDTVQTALLGLAVTYVFFCIVIHCYFTSVCLTGATIRDRSHQRVGAADRRVTATRETTDQRHRRKAQYFVPSPGNSKRTRTSRR